MSRSRRKSRQLNRADTTRQLRRANKGQGGMPWPAASVGTLNGRPVYEGHMIQAVPQDDGRVMLVVGVGPPEGLPRAFACMCPHAATELADELRALAMEHIAQCRHDGP